MKKYLRITFIILVILLLFLIVLNNIDSLINFHYNTITVTEPKIKLKNGINGSLKVNLKGRTLTNRTIYGDCEDTSKVYLGRVSTNVDSQNYLFGSKSLKVTVAYN